MLTRIGDLNLAECHHTASQPSRLHREPYSNKTATMPQTKMAPTDKLAIAFYSTKPMNGTRNKGQI